MNGNVLGHIAAACYLSPGSCMHSRIAIFHRHSTLHYYFLQFAIAMLSVTLQRGA